MTDLFSVIAHEDANDQSRSRKAMALSIQRVEDRFGAFVRQGSVDDQAARYDLVHADLVQVVASACAQVGYGSPEQIESVLGAIKRNFVTGDAAPQLRTASIRHEARKPKMCPYHSEVTDISLAAGEPQAGFNAMAQHAWGEKHCQGEGYKGDRCKFKPAMTTQSYWDERAETLEQRRQERAEREEQQRLEQERQVQELPEVETPTEESVAENPEAPSSAEAEGIVEHNEPSAIGEGAEEIPMAMAAGVKLGAVYCEDCGKVIEPDPSGSQGVWHHAGSDGYDEDEDHTPRPSEHLSSVKTAETATPSPKMDKRKWTPKTVEELEVDEDDGRYPTRRKDVTMPVKIDQGSRFDPSGLTEIGEPTTERQDVTQKGGPAKTDQGGTFGGGERSAVSSTLLPTDKVREALSKYKRA